jgi:acetaldehyde dehydrogenase (acetylating)
MNEEETKIVGDCLISEKGAMNASFVGRSAEVIAEKAGISIPKGTTVLIGEQLGVGKGYPLSYEKLTCVLAFYTVKDWEEACHLSIKLLKNGGLGHSMSIHSQNEEIIMKFAAKPVSRILVNTPSSLGGVGLLTGLAPSFTLGCGAMAGSATSDNVTPLNLINIKRVAYGIKDFVRPVKAVSCDDKSTCSDISSINASDIANIVANIISKLK